MKLKLLFIIILFVKNFASQSAWQLVQMEFNEKITRFYFVNEDTGVVIGDFPNNHLIYHTIDGGVTWPSFQTDENNIFLSIDFADKNTGWILGYNCTGQWPERITKTVIYKTTDSGATWDLICDQEITDNPEKIQFMNDKTGWILDRENKCLLRSQDGGRSWEKYELNMPSRAIVDFYFLNDTTGFACYEGIFKTTDGGETWIKKQNDLSCGDFHCIQFVNENVGWAGGHVIYKTEDGGETWQYQKKLGTPSSGYGSEWCFFYQ